MSLSAVLLLVLVGAGALLSSYLYLRIEPRVAGTPLLLGLRVAAFAVLGLVLLDPVVPGAPPPAGDRRPADWLLLDPELALTTPLEAPAWDTVVARAAAAERAGVSLAVLGSPGAGPEGVDGASLAARSPTHPTADPTEGVMRLAEAGAREIRLVGAFRWHPATLDQLREAAPVPILLERVGGEVRNVGVGRLELPRAVRAGEAIEGTVELFWEGTGPGDTVEVEVRSGELSLESFRIPLEEGRGSVARDLVLPAPDGPGEVRYVARAHLPGDAFPFDDERVRRVAVGEPEGGIVLVSLRPDWEPRRLLPALEAVTGLEGEGYLRVGDDRFLALAAPDSPAELVPPARIRERIGDALLLVVHGADQAPGWLVEAAGVHPRVLHLPVGPEGAALAGLRTGPPRAGEWSVEPDPPPTALAPFVRGLVVAGLPPLSAVLPVAGGVPGTAAEPRPALNARGREGGSEAVVVLVETSSGRRVVAPASGFWRWDARGGEGRAAYRGLWAGAADWLLAGPALLAGDEVRPSAPEQPRGRPLEWIVPASHEGAQVAIRSADGDEGVGFDGPLEPGTDARALTPSLPPGIYRYEARSVRSTTGDTLVSSGEVEVESWAPSLVRPPLDVPGRIEPAPDTPGREVSEAGRRLRTSALPYLAILLLLSAEWIGRRWWGLR